VNRSGIDARRVAAAAVLFCLALASSAAAQFGKNKITYREFRWQVYHSPHFDVYYYEDEKASLEKIVSFAESAYDRLSREFDHQIKEPIPIIFYLTHSEFEQNNIMGTFIPESVGAFASPVRNRMVLPVDLPDAELFALVMHELTHVFQYSVLFEGRLGRGLGAQPPQWFMEGMASYMAKDESTSRKMFLRDAVVNDAIPSITQRGVSGFLAYRFGHAAFDYIEERWGKEGFRDFLYEFRNTLGSRPDRAIERAFHVKSEDFDVDFRRWLRKKYLPQLVATGEPSDFGRPFRNEQDPQAEMVAPAASPSGDLVAALATTRGDLDILLFDAKKREVIGNLSKGFSSDYQYLVAQYVTTGDRMGRDLAFSPDGNSLAVFAKREKGRSLLIYDVLKRKLVRSIAMEVEQQLGPAWSPDGRKIAFAGNRNGHFDVFVIDLDTAAITNLTDDDTYDGAPVFSPDGRSIVYTASVGGDHGQLFQIELADPKVRKRLTSGDWTDQDAVFGSDGKWLYFASDRTGAFNIFAMELATAKTEQLTNAVTGCFNPTVLRSDDGKDRLVYTGYWRGRFDLYVTDLEQTIGEPQILPPPAEPVAVAALPSFEPDIRVSLDKANEEKYRRSRLFLEDGGGSIGVTTDQNYIAQAFLSFTDYLGDRRLFLLFDSIETFSNFDFTYTNMAKRWNWSLEAFDNRQFFLGFDNSRGTFQRGRAIFRQTGAVASWSYPFTVYHRVEFGGGYIFRAYDFQQVVYDEAGNPVYSIEPRKDNYPIVRAALTGDTTVQASFGPVTGRRWQLQAQYGYDTSGGGTLTSNVDFDWRQYLQLSERSQFAIRAFAGYAGGNFPSPYFFGGLDTVRGFDFRSLVGDRAFFTNLELRFPLVDTLATPIFYFQGIRGRIFVDIGGAWRSYAGETFKFWDSDNNHLFHDDLTSSKRGGVSSYGWGVTVNFVGLDLNWDFSKQWDLKNSTAKGFRTDFWIGTRF
jgi:hypothetical protein